ncbi:5-amino-6-(5-phospho-D-ribitylamino)uracil phosphatase YigB [Vibrio ouci]|uniref:5-amino-6-(5-phospho-D-ribitylamino)uracil phosphatase YigB n=1 Tax=Vibrio ouci TaxID=2499078 RepID=A0A4Y8WBC9_9VIBR|nr:5-amino-6-(5-phospho-D-ribitylamino)uracil phosphatase YigB [Vibrio ouci]TFH89875.1 5-amino-6-(5-phospho-D-ribitylamino)uracil phosphatase YigB [Vibrio ouci]
MKFYRHLNPIKAMTFDLDDTLYDNRPIIRRVEAQMAQWMHQHHPVSATKPLGWWHELKMRLAQQDSWLLNDVTLWRFKQIESGLMELGYPQAQATQAANEAVEQVHRLRSDFTVLLEAHQVLEQLASRLPLVAITNGNVDVEKIGLAPYFSLVLKAGPDGYAKPHRELFDKAQSFLSLPAGNILHVGDHLISDVAGAKRSGFQACWFNDQGQDIYACSKSRTLPDVEVNRLHQLLLLSEM